MSGAAAVPGTPVQTPARLLDNRSAGAYRVLTLTGDGVAAAARPGQFVTLAVGDLSAATLLRRAFSIHRVRRPGPDTGAAGTVEIVVAGHGPGTQWLATREPGVTLDLVGPLGKPFPLPTGSVPCVLVGGGYGSAPLFWLAEVLRARGCHVEMVLGAATRESLYGVDIAADCADAVVVTTDDGSLGVPGWVSDVLAEVVAGSRAAVVYGCGPMGMLHAVSQIAQDHGAVAQVAVEEAMACGVGVCMTCVLPVRGAGGQTRMVRACVEGPVFRGDQVRWEAFEDGWGRVPADCVGAPGRVGGVTGSGGPR
ncbi:MAG TPA: dihydroorotate dehydrogenase electron transfer subunit [Dermatophilaceae bacterium]|nr:dihydroorotate dehydrogenase electron transfer subunit [Dermatophilaceae bacterium]